MPPSPDDLPLFQQLLDAAHLNSDPRWRQLAADPQAVHDLVAAATGLAAQPKLQAEPGAAVQFVVGHRVFNLRPLVWPAVVAALVHVTVIVAPALESPLLNVVDAVEVLRELGDVYRTLDDDEVDVFGAAADLYAGSKRHPELTNPDAYPTAAGVTAWFLSHGYEPPDDIPGALHSLVHKGALLADEMHGGQSLYRPTFLGKKRD